MIQLSYVTSLPYENEISEHEICIFTRINISMVKLNFTTAAVCLLRSETLKIAFHIERARNLPLEFNFYNFDRQTFDGIYQRVDLREYICFLQILKITVYQQTRKKKTRKTLAAYRFSFLNIHFINRL